MSELVGMSFKFDLRPHEVRSRPEQPNLRAGALSRCGAPLATFVCASIGFFAGGTALNAFFYSQIQIYSF